MIVGITLTIMLLLTILSIVFGQNFGAGIVDSTTEGTTLINGTSTTVVLGQGDVLFSIDLIEGAIPIMAVMLVVVILLGITALATGLSPQSVKIGTFLIFYIGIWVLLSINAEPLIRSIEIFGGLLYVVLTVGYTFGVFQSLSGGNSE